jgi:SprT protein
MTSKSVPPRPPIIDGRKLLTPALEKKIETRVRELLDLAKTLWPEQAAKFDTMPDIRYDVKSRVGGLASSQWYIRLNLVLCFENEEHFIDKTVAHEVAHLIQFAVHGHTTTNEKGEVKKVRAQSW